MQHSSRRRIGRQLPPPTSTLAAKPPAFNHRRPEKKKRKASPLPLARICPPLFGPDSSSIGVALDAQRQSSTCSTLSDIERANLCSPSKLKGEFREWSAAARAVYFLNSREGAPFFSSSLLANPTPFRTRSRPFLQSSRNPNTVTCAHRERKEEKGFVIRFNNLPQTIPP